MRKVFTIALLAISFEFVANFYFQFDLLDPIPALSALAVLLVSQLALIASVWLGSGRSLWFGIHSLSTLVILIFWPIQVADPAVLTSDFKPWVWWAIGIASLSASIAWNNIFAWLYIVVNPVAWLLISLQPEVGEVLLADSLRDSTYLLLFPALLGALISVLRAWVAGVDEASSEAISSAIARARIDAVERERQRLDALVHDQVLHTLLSAAVAQTAEEKSAVATLARESIARLEQIAVDIDPTANVSASGLFRALRKAAIRLSPEVKISLSTSHGRSISAAVAEALTAATIQALENALQHSEAPDIIVEMRVTPEKVEITVSDNGKGFIIDRVPRNRIGLQTSIIQRVRAVGGEAQISSKPGTGTRVILSWSA